MTTPRPIARHAGPMARPWLRWGNAWLLASMALSLASRALHAADLPIRHLARHDIPCIGAPDCMEAIGATNHAFLESKHWEQFWTTNSVQAPPVGFSTNAAVVVLAGPKPDAGHDVEVRRLAWDRSTGTLTVHVTDWLPNPRRAHAQVVVFPFDVVVFPRPDQPVKHVRFLRQSKVRPMP